MKRGFGDLPSLVEFGVAELLSLGTLTFLVVNLTPCWIFHLVVVEGFTQLGGAFFSVNLGVGSCVHLLFLLYILLSFLVLFIFFESFLPVILFLLMYVMFDLFVRPLFMCFCGIINIWFLCIINCMLLYFTFLDTCSIAYGLVCRLKVFVLILSL